MRWRIRPSWRSITSLARGNAPVAAASVRPRGASLLRFFALGTAATLAQVIDVERLDELLEHRELFLVDRSGLVFGRAGLAFTFLCFKYHASLVQHGLFYKDRHFGANGQRDGVAGARVDFQVLAVLVEDEARVEGLVGEIVDDDLGELGAELLDHAAEEVVGEGPADRHVLHRYGDGVGLELADPDRQEARPGLLFQHDHALVVRHIDAYALDVDLDHLWISFAGPAAEAYAPAARRGHGDIKRSTPGPRPDRMGPASFGYSTPPSQTPAKRRGVGASLGLPPSAASAGRVRRRPGGREAPTRTGHLTRSAGIADPRSGAGDPVAAGAPAATAQGRARRAQARSTGAWTAAEAPSVAGRLADGASAVPEWPAATVAGSQKAMVVPRPPGAPSVGGTLGLWAQITPPWAST